MPSGMEREELCLGVEWYGAGERGEGEVRTASSSAISWPNTVHSDSAGRACRELRAKVDASSWTRERRSPFRGV